MSDEEKKAFLLKQADMYLSGMSYRQIAKVVDQSYVTVRDNLTVKIRYIAPNKYMEVMEKIEENKEKSIEDASVRERILEAYRLLTSENKTVVEIANILGTTEFTIYRDLTKRLKELNSISPEIVTEKMLNNVQSTLKEHSLANISSDKNVPYANYLYKLFPTDSKRNAFLTKCVLTFGLKLETLSLVLQINIDDLKKELLYKANPLYDSLNKTFQFTIKRQDIACQDFEKFLKRLIKSSLEKDSKKIEMILGEISDRQAATLIKKRNLKAVKISDDDVLTILKFQLKYMFTIKRIEDIFGISRSYYKKRIRELGDHPELIAEFNYLCDLYNYIYFENERNGR